MTIVTFEGDVRGIRGDISTRREHCDTFVKLTWKHFVTSSSPATFFPSSGSRGMISVSRDRNSAILRPMRLRNSLKPLISASSKPTAMHQSYILYI